QSDEREVQHQKDDVADVHAGDDCPYELRMLLEEHRTWLQAVHHQTAQEHRQGRTRWQSEGKQRNKSSAASSVIRTLYGGNTLNRAMSETFGILRTALFRIVGHECRDGSAAARQ